MPLTVNLKTYDNDVSSANSFRYVGPDHTFSNKDYIDLKRTAPKPTPTFAGVSRSEAKLTRGMTDGTDPLADSIIGTNVSIPVGAAAAEIDALIDDHAAWIASTAFKDLVKKHDINQ